MCFTSECFLVLFVVFLSGLPWHPEFTSQASCLLITIFSPPVSSTRIARTWTNRVFSVPAFVLIGGITLRDTRYNLCVLSSAKTLQFFAVPFRPRSSVSRGKLRNDRNCGLSGDPKQVFCFFKSLHLGGKSGNFLDVLEPATSLVCFKRVPVSFITLNDVAFLVLLLWSPATSYSSIFRDKVVRGWMMFRYCVRQKEGKGADLLFPESRALFFFLGPLGCSYISKTRRHGRFWKLRSITSRVPTIQIVSCSSNTCFSWLSISSGNNKPGDHI